MSHETLQVLPWAWLEVQGEILAAECDCVDGWARGRAIMVRRMLEVVFHSHEVSCHRRNFLKLMSAFCVAIAAWF